VAALAPVQGVETREVRDRPQSGLVRHTDEVVGTSYSFGDRACSAPSQAFERVLADAVFVARRRDGWAVEDQHLVSGSYEASGAQGIRSRECRDGPRARGVLDSLACEDTGFLEGRQQCRGDTVDRWWCPGDDD